MTHAQTPKQFVVCVNNHGYQASLEARKIYEVIPDESANQRGLIKENFVPIEVPKAFEKSLSSG